jgi:hypothetical protein
MKPASEVATASLLAVAPVRGLSLSRSGLRMHIGVLATVLLRVRMKS